MLHGYGSSNAYSALLAKNLALNNYEVFAIDMRGQGESGGERGMFDSEQTIYDDHWSLIFEACKRYNINQQTMPIFLYGRSFGGLIATKMAASTIGKSMFRGVVLLSPFYKSYGDRLEKMRQVINVLRFVKPHYRLDSKP